jgi:hypothetical protein
MTYKLVKILVNGDSGTAGLPGGNFSVTAIGRFGDKIKLWTGDYRLRPGEKLAIIKPLVQSKHEVVE